MTRLLAAGLALLLTACGIVEGDEELPEGDGSFDYLPGEEAHEANAPKRVGECRLTLSSEDPGRVVWSHNGPELSSSEPIEVALDACQNAFVGTTAADGESDGHVAKHYPHGELAWNVAFPFSQAVRALAVSSEGWVVAALEGGDLALLDSRGRHEKLAFGKHLFWLQQWGSSWFGADGFFDMAKFSLPSGELSAGSLWSSGGPFRLDALLVGDEALTLNHWRNEFSPGVDEEIRLYRARIRPHSSELEDPWPAPVELSTLPAVNPAFGEIFSDGSQTWFSVTDADRFVDSVGECSTQIHRVEPANAVWVGDCFIAGALFVRGDHLVAIGVSDVGAPWGYALTQLVLDAEGKEIARHVWEDVPLFAGEEPGVARYEDGSLVVAGKTEEGSWMGRVTLWD